VHPVQVVPFHGVSLNGQPTGCGLADRVDQRLLQVQLEQVGFVLAVFVQ